MLTQELSSIPRSSDGVNPGFDLSFTTSGNGKDLVTNTSATSNTGVTYNQTDRFSGNNAAVFSGTNPSVTHTLPAGIAGGTQYWMAASLRTGGSLPGTPPYILGFNNGVNTEATIRFNILSSGVLNFGTYNGSTHSNVNGPAYANNTNYDVVCYANGTSGVMWVSVNNAAPVKYSGTIHSSTGGASTTIGAFWNGTTYFARGGNGLINDSVALRMLQIMQPNPVFSTGLVLEYLGDGNALDTNDGTKATLVATNVSYASCPVGYQKQWGVFNGSNSSVRTTTTITHGNVFDVSINFQRGTPSGEDMVVTRWGSASGKNRWGVGFIGGTTDLKINIGLENTWRTIKASVDTNPHRVRFTYNISTQTVNCYFDGVLTLTFTTDYAEETGWPITVGDFNTNAGPYNGLAGGLRIFNRLLTDTEALAYFHEFNRQLGGGSDFGAYIPQPVFHCDWMGDSCDVANGKTSTDTNVTQGSSDFQGLPRAALIGSSSNIKNGTGSLITSNNYTRYVIFKMPATWVASDNPRIFDLENTAGNANATIWAPWSAAGKFTVTDYAGSSSFLYSSLGPVASTWYCIAHVQTGTTAKIHVKPFGSARTTNSGTINGITPGTDKITFAGCYSGGNYLPGALFWDAGIINSSLSDSQIDALFSMCEMGIKPYAFRRTLPASLSNSADVAILPYITASGQPMVASGAVTYGTLTGSPSVVRVQQNNSILCGNGKHSSFSGVSLANKSFSIMFWAYDKGTDGKNNEYFCLGTTSTRAGLNIMSRETNNKVTFGFYNDDLDSTNVVNRNGWTHWCMRYDSATKTQSIYRNGYFDTSRTTGGDFTGTGNLIQGAWFTGTGSYEKLLGDVTFYYRVVSPNEIRSHRAATFRF